MEVQGNGIFVFPRKGLGLEGTEVIPGKLAALLFVSQEQEESEGAQMLPAELVWWSHRMTPPRLTLGYSEPAQGQGTPKGAHCQRLPCSPGPQHLSISYRRSSQEPPYGYSSAQPFWSTGGVTSPQSQASPFHELSVGRRGKPRSLWAGRLLAPVGGPSRDGGWCVPILLSLCSSPGSRECRPVSASPAAKTLLWAPCCAPGQ